MKDISRIGLAASPWGPIDSHDTLAPGITFTSTSSHGGIHLDDDHERQIPVEVRHIARTYAPAGWYEEDCDLVIPVLWFSHELEKHGHADMVRHCQPLRLEARYRLLDEALTQLEFGRKARPLLDRVSASTGN
jgi:hypothetical protein